MCPPYVPTLPDFFLIGLDHTPSCLTLPFEKEVVRMEVLEKKN